MSKSMMRSIKNVTNGYTAAQVKVRNATSNDAWGPSTQDMQDIAQLTFQNHELFEVMDMIDRRLNDKGKNWRHVMKSLTLLHYLIQNGSENVVLWSKDNLYVIKTLREFQYIDEEGRDQGANIRAKAKELTTLLNDDDRLREERGAGRNNRRRRANSRGNSTQSAPTSRRGTVSNSSPPRGDSELERALEESRRTAEEDAARRRTMEGGSDEDLRKAILLSEEEEAQRSHQTNASNFFEHASASQPNLIDTTDVWAQSAAQQQVPQQQYYIQQPVQYMQTGTDLFGNPVYMQPQQQPVATGMLQNAYTTGGGLPYGANPYQQQQQQQQPQFQQQQQQPLEELKPLKTGSNNPFAKLNQQPTIQQPTQAQPSLYQIQQQQQQQNQPQPQQQAPAQLKPQRTNNFDQSHMSNLNTLLSEGEGIDTFGNVGELRFPAQHTTSTFVNSAGQKTGNGQGYQPSNNPFMAQYTGVATTNQIQPAFTGYGFGNAPQSQQAHHQRQQNGQANNNLIDL